MCAQQLQRSSTDAYRQEDLPICKFCPYRDSCVSLCQAARRLVPGEHKGRGERTYTAGNLEWGSPVGGRRASSMADIFRSCRKLLTRRQFEVGERYYGLAMSQSEIAGELGVRRQTVGRILSQARRRLIRKCLPMLHRVEKNNKTVGGSSLGNGHPGGGISLACLLETPPRCASHRSTLPSGRRPDVSRTV